MIKVAIIEDRPEIREGLSTLLAATGGFELTGRYRSMEEALEKIGAAPPDVVLVDLGLPRMSGTEGIRILKQQYPGLALLVLTVYDEDERIFDALCAGACGYLLKKTPAARIVEGIREALDGGAPMSPEVARRVVDVFRVVRPPARSDYQLTPHETRLLALLIEGHNYRTAAAELSISINTVSYHMRRIYEKLQVHSKSEAVSKALRGGLIR